MNTLERRYVLRLMASQRRRGDERSSGPAHSFLVTRHLLSTFHPAARVTRRLVTRGARHTSRLHPSLIRSSGVHAPGPADRHRALVVRRSAGRHRPNPPRSRIPDRPDGTRPTPPRGRPSTRGDHDRRHGDASAATTPSDRHAARHTRHRGEVSPSSIPRARTRPRACITGWFSFTTLHTLRPFEPLPSLRVLEYILSFCDGASTPPDRPARLDLESGPGRLSVRVCALDPGTRWR